MESSNYKFQRPVFKPEEWKEKYLENPLYEQSVLKIMEIEKLPREIAERKLMDILLKATCIECCIQMHGAQTFEQLSENIAKFTEGKMSLITSDSDLQCTLEDLDMLFFRNRLSKDYTNTGAGFRTFVQNLVVKLSLGSRVRDNDMNALLKEHYAQRELGIVEGSFEDGYIEFLKKELLVTFKSFKHLSIYVRGFCYDSETGELTLTDTGANRLCLHLPILANLISTGSMDLSRTVSGVYSVLNKQNGYEVGIITAEVLAGAKVNFRKKVLIQATGKDWKPNNETLKRQETWFKAVLHPNNRLGPVEVFQCSSHNSNMKGRYSAPETIESVVTKTGKTTAITFKNINEATLLDLQNDAFSVDPKLLFVEEKNQENESDVKEDKEKTSDVEKDD